MIDTFSFLSIFLLTNIIFSAIIYLLIISFLPKIKNIDKNNFLLIIASLGLSPALTSLILNYIILFFPHYSTLFYFSFILLIFLIPFFWIFKKIKKIKIYVNELFIYIKSISNIIRIFLLLFLSIYIFIWVAHFINNPITDNDTFQYASWGKTIFRQKEIKFQKYNFDQNTKFYFQAEHGLSYPLLKTWNNIVNKFFNTNNDFYFRSITGYYLLLIFLTIFIILYSLNRKFASWLLLIYLLIPVNLYLFNDISLDSYRIFFFLLATVFFIRLIRGKDYLSLIIFSVTSGLAANIHSISAVIIPFYIVVYIIFYFRDKKFIKKIILIICLLFAFGYFHYTFDAIYGSGWIFKYIIPTTKFEITTLNTAVVDKNPKKIEKVMKSNFQGRGLESREKLIQNGYLGHLFRFSMIGLFNWLLIPALIIFIFKKNKQKYEYIVIVIYSISFTIIAFYGYSNARYSLTLLPITFILIVYFLNTYLLKIKKINLLFLVCIIISLIWSLININLARYQFNYLVSIIPIKEIQNKWTKYKNTLNSYHIDERQDIPQLRLINNLKKYKIDQENTILADEEYFLNYYTDFPTYYYYNSSILTNNGPIQLNNKKILINNKVKYILTNKNYYSNKSKNLNYFLKSAKLIYKDNYYLVFFINKYELN